MANLGDDMVFPVNVETTESRTASDDGKLEEFEKKLAVGGENGSDMFLRGVHNTASRNKP